MNPHITVSAPEPYIVHITYINANKGNIDFLINILKLNFFSSLNINIISALTANKYTGRYDKVANTVINVNASTIPFWKFITNNILTNTDPNINSLTGFPVYSSIFQKNLGNTPSTPAAYATLAVDNSHPIIVPKIHTTTATVNILPTPVPKAFVSISVNGAVL